MSGSLDASDRVSAFASVSAFVFAFASVSAFVFSTTVSDSTPVIICNSLSIRSWKVFICMFTISY
jgi:hypothetical protein